MGVNISSDINSCQEFVNQLDENPELVHTLTKSIHQQQASRVYLFFNIVHQRIDISDNLFHLCFNCYQQMVISITNTADKIKQASGQICSELLSDTLNDTMPLLKELQAIANQKVQNDDILSSSQQFSLDYQTTIDDYLKQFNDRWWNHRDQRRQITPILKTVTSELVDNLLLEIRKLQYDIIRNEEKNSLNNKGYRQLLEISQLLNQNICLAILATKTLPQTVHQMVVKHLRYQKITLKVALLSRIPEDNETLRQQIQSFFATVDLSRNDKDTFMQKLDKSLPKDLHYLIPLCSGCLTDVPVTFQKDNTPTIIPKAI